VINDGSSDKTLRVLIEEFRLYRSSRVAIGQIPTAHVRGVYESRDPIPLIVIDKKNAGKADALNCALNYSRNELVAVVDADSIIQKDALLQISRSFLERPEETVAVGGLIRIANGCSIENGDIKHLATPDSLLARFQIIDYLRAFLGSRAALSFAGTLLVISGAFGMFRRKVLLDAGGYRLDTVGEDMELVVRLHRQCWEQKKAYRIDLSSNAVCWTEAPERSRTLRRQRARWQRGCVESVLFHRCMIGNGRFGVVGVVGMPYFLLCEILGPVIEVTGYILTVMGLLLGLLSSAYVMLFFAVSVLFGVLLSVGAVVLEETTNCKYPKVRDLLRLLQAALLENLGYRQRTLLWRLQGIAHCLRNKKRVWGDMERRGFRRAC
jgi:cellulose synthase/poly-beta-1,6-N-acetylglucosamine synthase-like glycosyltransferase